MDGEIYCPCSSVPVPARRCSSFFAPYRSGVAPRSGVPEGFFGGSRRM
jgi:hypothetical protein